MSPAERWALWHLAARGPITAEALARRLGADPAGLSVLFEALGRHGYVEPDPQGVPDLSAKGRRALVMRARARHAGRAHRPRTVPYRRSATHG
jgi:DNA-binding IclR family transcriptional regulator